MMWLILGKHYCEKHYWLQRNTGEVCPECNPARRYWIGEIEKICREVVFGPEFPRVVSSPEID